MAESGETAEEIAPRSTGPLAAIDPNFARHTAACWNTGILLIIAPNSPILQIQTNSTAFLIIASDTSQYSAVVPILRCPISFLNGFHANPLFVEACRERPSS